MEATVRDRRTWCELVESLCQMEVGNVGGEGGGEEEEGED